MKQAMPHPLRRFPLLCLCAALSCLLWGSAIPTIKLCYRYFGIDNGAIGSLLLFAGLRFVPAGLLVLLFGSLSERKPLIPRASDWAGIVRVALFQTFLQYLCYYIAMAYAPGVTVAILSGTNTFFSIAIAALLFRMEALTVNKTFGCVLGFTGIVLAQCVGGGSLDFSLLGDVLMVISAFSSGMAAVLIRRYSAGTSPVLLSGYQFVLGGLGLTAAGLLSGGSMGAVSVASLSALLYLAFVSAVAYTLWSCLLKYNPVSRVAVFGFLTPLFGTALSALMLGEGALLQPTLITALVLVCAGILCVNLSPKAN